MTRTEQLGGFPKRLLQWYATAKRDLPWRHTRDPYAILVSEIMLQQTQVDRVIPKYKAWLKRWPNVKSLSRASLRSVLQQWSGLGYNRRAKYVREAASVITEHFHGRWPKTHKQLRQLPGVGEYTADAIMAFAFNKRVGIVDTNVRRVLSRVFFGLRQPNEEKIHQLANDVVPPEHPSDWHHALMDLGATICVSRRPKCEICPVQQYCRAYPQILNQPPIKKSGKSQKFETTDRYWRGQLIRAVTAGPQGQKSLFRKLQHHGSLSPQCFAKLLRGLKHDGLISLSGAKVSIAS